MDDAQRKKNVYETTYAFLETLEESGVVIDEFIIQYARGIAEGVENIMEAMGVNQDEDE